MRQGILKIDDLNPDGVRIVVNWERMVTSSSVFILCINTSKCVKQVEKIAKRKGWTLETQIKIENNKLGVRIWRVL
jgi:hypothetical protein|tara:strand:+ start:2808 stop:3035 length:228 start_codon:yes stop_codon:yes gene_type:complete